MHIVKSDTLTYGISWLDKRLYGEGGLQLHFGKRILCFWDEEELECPYCLSQGEHWPLAHEVWRCPSCDTEYRDE